MSDEFDMDFSEMTDEEDNFELEEPNSGDCSESDLYWGSMPAADKVELLDWLDGNGS